jgi:hypothetical protein
MELTKCLGVRLSVMNQVASMNPIIFRHSLTKKLTGARIEDQCPLCNVEMSRLMKTTFTSPGIRLHRVEGPAAAL